MGLLQGGMMIRLKLAWETTMVLMDSDWEREGESTGELEQYLHAIDIKDVDVKVNTTSMCFTDVALLWWHRRSTDKMRDMIKEYVKEFKELMLQMTNLSEKKTLFFIDRKDKFEFSKPKEKGNGGEDEGQVEYINKNGGN
ncbi:hypothetical protein Goarm_023422 [Gossypium armourianum]|uniref:Uncharacterized protein n=1 Tax=Gossypium armourianum TaxID=34283 RepID=A0A7J9KHF8_9ROSI|nr:hypothetical protein [Gossypium armourianum]